MNFNKTLLLSAIIAVSNSAFADDTQSFVVELTGEIAPELAFTFVDELDQPVPSVQNVTMEEVNGIEDSLLAKDIFVGTSIKSNDPAQNYVLKRTLSPFAVDGDEASFDALLSQLAIDDSNCDEDHALSAVTTSTNEQLELSTSIAGGDKLCGTNISADWDPTTGIPVGTYTSTLTLDITPEL
ncbi:hypothetical protein [Vibrio alginolyticus]|uniref:hypothetical protein n=1 Tax=Vibrio alginolyticus TaxID=663 RepID=UPI0015F72B7F|nr:hypothetical protein [Vibrio alginolyticus]